MAARVNNSDAWGGAWGICWAGTWGESWGDVEVHAPSYIKDTGGSPLTRRRRTGVWKKPEFPETPAANDDDVLVLLLM